VTRLGAFALLAILATPARAQYDPAAPEPISKIRGSLVIGGGGSISDAIADRFVELAGGRDARIVVIPTASARADDDATTDEPLEMWKKREPASVAILHTRDRERANEPEFIEPLLNATGLWFGGGDQTKITDAYGGTAVQRAIHGVLDRGGVVGGTSAGAAVMSRVMIAGGNPKARVATGFDLLPGSVIDQHFIARQRQDRLRGVIAEHPSLVGFGIDEGTALIVRGRSIEVMGESTVTVCLAASKTRPERFDELKAGQHADLIALSRAAAARSEPPFPPAEPPAPNVPSGSLIIIGGGGVPPGLMERFVELAGGPEAPIVVIPCTPDEVVAREPGDLTMLRRAGAKNVSWIHTKDRRRANSDDEFLAPLREARGLWFGGGRQWNFVDSYQNTTAHKLMHEVLARGGVIGGSSAGASIQGDYMPRGDPLGNLNIIAEGYERGLGFITGVAIDQHFTQRKRQPDMTSLVKTYPQLLGIGLDEGTAIVVRKNVAEVVGKNSVSFYDTRRAVEQDGDDHIALKEGQTYDLAARRVVENDE
jgi:cyanophycinase